MKKTYNQPNVEITTITSESITSDINTDSMSTYVDDWE